MDAEEIDLIKIGRGLHHFRMPARRAFLCGRTVPGHAEIIEGYTLAEAVACASEAANDRLLCAPCQARMKDKACLLST